MEWWLVLIIFLIYLILEIIISFFFNYKIYLITEKRFFLASFLGSISTFINALLIGYAAFFSISPDYGGEWWLIFITSIAMAIGNLIAANLVPKAKSYFIKRKENKLLESEETN